MEVVIDKDNYSIEKVDELCIHCEYCTKVCQNDVNVYGKYDLNVSKKPICIHCGQCANICPTEAIRERLDYLFIKKILKEKNKTVVFSVAPAVRVAFSELFGEEPYNVEGKIVYLLKELGADYVFDITFGADLTIMEEAYELVERIKKKERLPMFTSCCPAWVNYCEIFHPELLENLSTCKSPIAMQSSIIKTYFADKEGIDPKNIIHVVVAPCTAKKYECRRKELNTTSIYPDTDYVITTRELAMWMEEEHIDFSNLSSTKFDSPLGKGSSAGEMFGNTGGVCEAALRTAYHYMTGKDLDKLEFQEIRGMDGIKEASVDFDGTLIQVAVVNGMKYFEELLEKIKNGSNYHFVEVMNCIGGCIAGGGQPKMTMLERREKKLKRMNVIYQDDSKATRRVSYQNPDIVQLYSLFLESPGSSKAEHLLHTHYTNRSSLLEGGDICE